MPVNRDDQRRATHEYHDLLIAAEAAFRLERAINPNCVSWAASPHPGRRQLGYGGTLSAVLYCDHIRDFLDEVEMRLEWRDLCGMPEEQYLNCVGLVKFDAKRIELPKDLLNGLEKNAKALIDEVTKPDYPAGDGPIPAALAKKVADLAMELADKLRPFQATPGVSRAAAAVAKSTVPSNVDLLLGDPIEVVGYAPPAAAPSVVEPKPEHFRAYWFEQAGNTQERIAELLETNQGTISKWLSKVREWKAAGNAMPEIPKAERLNSQPTAIDPARLDLGPRSDHRAPHQAEKLAEIQGHDEEE